MNTLLNKKYKENKNKENKNKENKNKENENKEDENNEDKNKEDENNEDKNKEDEDKKELINYDDLIKILDNNNYYLNKKQTKNNIDKNTLKYLIKEINPSQQEMIKLGIILEKILNDIIINKSKLINNKNKNKKGIKEKDHLFFDNEHFIIYYAEIKSNLNLDTEKTNSTIDKIIQIEEELQIKYPQYIIKSFLVNIRYLKKDEIPLNIINKFHTINTKIYGLNDYFNELNLNIKFNYDLLKKIMILLINKLRNE